MEIVYQDKDSLVCVKPPRVLSTDEPGGLPELIREALGDPKADVRTVHRLDRVVSGLMVLARGSKSATILSEQVMSRSFGKEYLAVIHGCPAEKKGTLTDLLGRDKSRKMTYVAQEPGKDVREAVLDYEVIGEADGMSLVHITLHTGRTHQIRVQFASRNFPLLGERKYSTLEDDCPIALWSCRLRFDHPFTKEALEFRAAPPAQWPWNQFQTVDY